MTTQTAVFIVNLLQDVNVLRPLIFMAGKELALETLVLVTPQFCTRDTSGTWQAELAGIAHEADAVLYFHADEFDANGMLVDRHGVIVAGSESHLSAHKPVHDIFRMAPRRFLRITLQHGFECVGFRQSRDQDLAHGNTVTFGADVVCGWSEPDKLTALAASERQKLCVTGPAFLLQPPAHVDDLPDTPMGMVCENMHSPRLNIAGNFKADFLGIFDAFCKELGGEGRRVTLRPHPGGQYTLKNNVVLSDNVVVNNKPIYKIDLSRYIYGISAPSSILVDMVLAGIPTAVWQDPGSVMDLGNYAGLARISTLDEWLAFSRDAVANPARYIEKQKKFLAAQAMLTDKAEVRRRFASLLQVSPVVDFPAWQPPTIPVARPKWRVLYVSNAFIPTLQLSFIKPLAQLATSGELVFDLITEEHLKQVVWRSQGFASAEAWLEHRIRLFDPTVVVFCRYSGLLADFMLAVTRKLGVSAVYHIDDDLLNIPVDIGYSKHKYHSQPERLASVRHLLDHCDLVYCSTVPLQKQLSALGARAPLKAGAIYCSGHVINEAVKRKVRKIGYMGIGHEENLRSVLPALIRFLKKHVDIDFEFMGTIPVPDEFKQFGERIKFAPKIDDYGEFLQKFSEFQWDIGICPLTSITFNLLKANTKWVEYTSAGVAVVASAGTVYDSCCADGCGKLATTEDEWFAALDGLVDPEARYRQVAAAQQKLREQFSLDKLREQVLDMLATADRLQLLDAANTRQPSHVIAGKERILFVANAFVPTLQLSFLKPLAADFADGGFCHELITSEDFKKELWRTEGSASMEEWLLQKFAQFAPTLLVFCRYSGPHCKLLVDLARQQSIPSVYQIDDDLLHIPEDIGLEKFKEHNKHHRLATVRYLLDNVDLVYCSTSKLSRRLLELGVGAPVHVGQIYCPGEIIVPAELRRVSKVGYMASADHAHNLKAVLPAIRRYLRIYDDVTFEFFGSIPVPEELLEFGDRVMVAPKVDNYEEFLQTFAKSGWDIGICPLAPIHFNMMKANTKWVEYTSLGIAVIASRDTVYDECCANGCGKLADSEDEWFRALVELTADQAARFRQVEKAQKKLRDRYSSRQLRRQVLEVIAIARRLRQQAGLQIVEAKSASVRQ